MDLTNIRTFLRVVEVGSVAKAAEELKYAQSTVTSQIQALEKEIGNPLFERIGRKNHLTDVGVEFLQYATEIQNTLQKVSAIGHQGHDAEVSLRVGVLESLLFNNVLPALPVFRQRYPNSGVYLKEGHSAELIDMLKQNDLDIIYISDNINTDPALECLMRQPEQMVFIAGRNHPLAGRKNIPIEEVLDCPYVVTEPTGRCYHTLLSLMAERGRELHHSVMVNHIGAISVLLRDNISLSFLPKAAVSGALNIHELTVLDVCMPPQIYYRQLLVRRSMWRSPALEHFVSVIADSTKE